MNFTPTNPRGATHLHIDPSTGHTQAIFTHLEDLSLPVLWPTIPLCRLPAYPQMLTRLRRLSKDSYPLKYSMPIIPDARSFRAIPCHRGSYAGHSHTHRRSFGTCLPANSHTLPPGIPVFVSPQEFCTQQYSCSVAHHCTYLTRTGKCSFPLPPLPSRSLYNN
ncbi:hypothetical protein O181_108113 [Austropuccinia psidii MF-1]|uniref:Uncharacterized protein n=1 Tax=Austropuccinia psidii MF-1 TaxID=1389203 RepID=A0A9Q3PNJ1_9BASI|nr:hypothetical protein [Austropuccinia psidii MF-1]